MTPCPDRELALQALLDGELDAANGAALEEHLKSCTGCSVHYARLQALRARLAQADLATPAPAALRRRVAAALQKAERTRRTTWLTAAVAGWTAGALSAAAAGLLVVQLGSASYALEAQLVADHVRSLQPGHLIDVATSDRHVVRPWFNGRIDYALPVPDLAAQGFPLAGGRLDYADGRTIAALVYRRRAHVINLFVMPERGGLQRLAFAPGAAPPGYDVVRWREGGLEFWAVSDVEGGELQAFSRAFQAAAR
jgi:anti-sigma factor RsiW